MYSHILGAKTVGPMYAKTVYVKTHQTVHFKYVHLLDVNYAYFFFFSGLLAIKGLEK